ncbi:MAG: chemotaxis protein CheD [Promethearchaeota archaeon]
MRNNNRIDLVKDERKNGEIVLPIGHFALINSEYKNSSKPKISIYGLGSCIALILYDKLHDVAGMSHILLPSSKNGQVENYPHKFADSSVKDLMNEMKKKGAKLDNLKAAIIGGATIFKHQDSKIGVDNIRSIKKELRKHKLKVSKQDVGGFKGRIIKFNPNNYSILVKLTQETDFKEI